jgi:S1-C subfamily serine protease
MIIDSVIVCDGDVTVTGRNVTRSLVVARGNITLNGWTNLSVLIAGGKVTVEDKSQPKRDAYLSVIREDEPNPLGFITFFELTRVGLTVKVADGAVAVEKVSANSACAKAGVKVGDVILEAGGKKAADAESLRRLLRDALAIGDATVKLKRGNETLSLKVVLPE